MVVDIVALKYDCVFGVLTRESIKEEIKQEENTRNLWWLIIQSRFQKKIFQCKKIFLSGSQLSIKKIK